MTAIENACTALEIYASYAACNKMPQTETACEEQKPESNLLRGLSRNAMHVTARKEQQPESNLFRG